MISILYFILAVVLLFLGATFLWFLSEMIEGKQEFTLHFGNVLLATLVGSALFPFWGWKSTGFVLAGFGVLWMIGGLVDRFRFR